MKCLDALLYTLRYFFLRSLSFSDLELNVVNLSHRLIAAEEFSGLQPMVPWLLSSGPDRLGGSLK